MSRPDAPRPEIIPATFDELYPIFLLRRISPGEKAEMWERLYRGRWVRWRGKLTSITPTGGTFRMRPQTITFDLSVRFDAPGRARLRTIPVGSTIEFIATFNRYDDVLRTFYMDKGDVAPQPASDAGAP